MTEEIIQLPSVEDIKEMLAAAKEDISAEITESPELEPSTKLIFNLMEIVEEKIAKGGDLNQLNMKDKIAVAAHLNLLQCVLDDFFFIDDSDFFDDEEGDDDLELDEIEDKS